MEIAGGIASIGQALNVIKRLQAIERDLDVALVKSQLAEVYSSLADVKIALSDARERLAEKDREIATLSAKIEALSSGESCPICSGGQMKVLASRPHSIFGVLGAQERTIMCSNAACGHSEVRLHDPNKAMTG